MKFKGKKVKVTQIWHDEKVVPVTVVQLNENEALGELKEGDKVQVSGTSKGKGFQGVVKRHGFAGGPKTHGQKDRLRAPGSSGPTAPQRVIKGRKMAGHMGSERVTVKNLKVVSVEEKNRNVFLKGAIPGMIGGAVEIHPVRNKPLKAATAQSTQSSEDKERISNGIKK